MDHVHLVNHTVDHQTFEEATMWRPGYFARDDLFDTVLGLSLHPTYDDWHNFTSPSLFRALLLQKELDENLFTVQLARTDDEKGELVLGGLPHGVSKQDLVEVPVHPGTPGKGNELWDFYTSNGWQVLVEGITMSTSSGVQYPVSFNASVAVISSSYPYIALPIPDTERANQYIGLKEAYDWVECDTRANLPNFTVTFGPHRREVTLSPWDYLIEVYDDLYEQLKCVSAFASYDDVMDKGFILLGAAFLNGLYTVFDADRESISFGQRPLQTGAAI